MWLFGVIGGGAVFLACLSSALFLQAHMEQKDARATLDRLLPAGTAAPTSTRLLTRWRGTKLARQIQASLERAGLPWQSEHALLAWVGLAAVAALLLRIFFGFSWLVATVWGDSAVQIGWLWFTRQQRQAWGAKLVAALPGSLRLIANHLRAGYSLPSAIREAGRAASPCARVWARVARELALHQPLPEVLGRVTRDTPLPALGTLAPLLIVLYESGGELASALDKAAAGVEADEQTRQQMWSKSAEARMVGLLLPGMGLALLPIISLAVPGFAGFLFSGTGLLMLGAFGLTQALIWAWINNVAQVRL